MTDEHPPKELDKNANDRYLKKKRKTICFDDINDLDEDIEFSNSNRPKLSEYLQNMTHFDSFGDINKAEADLREQAKSHLLKSIREQGPSN